ncbi:hypothetical protein CANARDRAFT_29435 [[Candida] arabinofermentans NRRL YB-2248]|uniref:Uncharacterized protein n=1 Tax=[Candida] arabinofermentans NRRL YB-2248 TaxID=983967 RepID=A0A1E4SWT1_9ASCO|nr:hypothetical protein CANARDRAFT_29435 [[Candida] arabinofermentans NRRL YB-2248]
MVKIPSSENDGVKSSVKCSIKALPVSSVSKILFRLITNAAIKVVSEDKISCM